MEAPDQTDILEANERLTSQVATLTTERDQALEQVASLTAERDQALAQVATLTTERDQALAQTATFNSRLAAELTKYGIRPDGVKQTEPKPAKALTLTEQCLAARGAA